MMYLTKAKDRAKDDDQKIRSLLFESQIRQKNEGYEAAVTGLKTLMANFPARHQAKLWSRVAELHSHGGEKTSALIAAEIALQMEPLDKDLRFQLAYKYADGEATRLMAYFHYDRLSEQDERYPNCLNNMAVILEQLDMSARYVKVWKRAKEFDWPYPHGNLAARLATAGFIDEARTMIEELPERFRFESRPAQAIDFIANMQKEEAEKLEKLQKASDLFHKVYNMAAISIRRGFDNEISNVLGAWKSSLCDLSLEAGAEPDRLTGTLEKGGSKYRIKAQYSNNILSAEATHEGGALSILSWPKTYRLLLTWEREGRMSGVVYVDEVNPEEMTVVRRG
jgi:hypothetical protein